MSSPIASRGRSMCLKRKRSSSSQGEPSLLKLPKACWNDFTTKTLLEVMIEEIHAGNRVNKNINSEGWRNIVNKFGFRTGKPYTKVQLRNRASLVRKLYGKWRKLNDRATSLGVDPRTGAIRATDEWWEKMTMEDSKILKWRSAPPKFLDLMTECFGGNVATSQDTYCLGGRTFPRPSMPPPPVMPTSFVPYMSLGEAEVVASNYIPSSSSRPSCGSSAQNKSSRSGTPEQSAGDRTCSFMEKYVDMAKKKNDILEKICLNTEDMNDYVTAMSLVHKIKGINRNSPLYLGCLKVLKDKMNRFIFLTYVSSIEEEMQIKWFKKYM